MKEHKRGVELGQKDGEERCNGEKEEELEGEK